VNARPATTTPAPDSPTQAARGGFAPINGLQLYYEVHGSRKPLVVPHGGVLMIDLTFGPMIPVLAERHTVIAVELQGHGHTADIDREMRLDLLADDVATLLRHLAIAQADFFGFSLGGLVALTIATRSPHLVSKLVLTSCAFRRDGYHSAVSPPDTHRAHERPPTPEEFEAVEAAYRRVAPYPEQFPSLVARTSAMVAAVEDWSAATFARSGHGRSSWSVTAMPSASTMRSRCLSSSPPRSSACSLGQATPT
jgi:pimeloyl-ACP methyl ester carboxylesterase